ncbi:hypothetical protein OIE68_41050 [Nocardia vinacea]|uniref:hypothetical protein n=1 Tax=Nocardia vinacea TaxID=96468 RepID=UPI002E0D7F11|nr:hypothetical protein OIE68_41050 [Nocardia vinacea]
MSGELELVAALEIPVWPAQGRAVDLEQAEGTEPGWAVAPGVPGWVAAPGNPGIQGAELRVLVLLSPELVVVLGIPVWRGLVPVPVGRVPGWAAVPGNPGCWVPGWVAVAGNPGFRAPEL